MATPSPTKMDRNDASTSAVEFEKRLRELSTLLASHSSTIAATSTRLADVESMLTGVREENSTLKQVMAEQRNWLKGELSGIESRMQQVFAKTTSKDKVEADVGLIREEMTGLLQEVKQLRTSVDERAVKAEVLPQQQTSSTQYSCNDHFAASFGIRVSQEGRLATSSPTCTPPAGFRFSAANVSSAGACSASSLVHNPFDTASALACVTHFDCGSRRGQQGTTVSAAGGVNPFSGARDPMSAVPTRPLPTPVSLKAAALSPFYFGAPLGAASAAPANSSFQADRPAAQALVDACARGGFPAAAVGGGFGAAGSSAVGHSVAAPPLATTSPSGSLDRRPLSRAKRTY